MAISTLILTDGVTTLDFHSAAYRILSGGLSLSPPPLKPEMIKSPFMDGDRLASARYSNRTIAIRFLLSGTDRDDLLTNQRAIERLLNDAQKRILLGYDAQVYLEYQWDVDAGESVYFDVDYGELILPANFSSVFLWRNSLITDAVVRLNCKPFGRYTDQNIAEATLENEQDGAALNYQDITTLAGHGDVPAKLGWKITQTGATDPKKVWLAKRSGLRQLDNLFFQGEDETNSVELIDGEVATSDEGDAALSGGEYRRTTLNVCANGMATDTPVCRHNYDLPNPPRGQFRILTYSRTTAAGAAAEYAKMAWGYGYSYGDKTKAPSEAQGEYYSNAEDNIWGMLDLGVINIPPITESELAPNNIFQLRIFQYAKEVLAGSDAHVDPDGFVDHGGTWLNHAWAYDTNIAQSATEAIPLNSWGNWIELTHAAIELWGLRFYCNNVDCHADIDEVEIEAWYDGGWQPVYGPGAFALNTWLPKYFTDDLPHSVTAVQFKFHNSSFAGARSAGLSEVDLIEGASVHTWDLDYIFLLPIDEGVVIIDDVDPTDVILIDSITDPPNVFILSAANVIEDFPDKVGKPFTLGRESTRLYVLRDDVKGVTFTSNVRYQPRFVVV